MKFWEDFGLCLESMVIGNLCGFETGKYTLLTFFHSLEIYKFYKNHEISFSYFSIFFLFILNKSIVATASYTEECHPAWMFLFKSDVVSLFSPTTLLPPLSLYYENSEISIFWETPFQSVNLVTSKSLCSVCPTNIFPISIFLTFDTYSAHLGAFFKWLNVIPVIGVIKSVIFLSGLMYESYKVWPYSDTMEIRAKCSSSSHFTN